MQNKYCPVSPYCTCETLKEVQNKMVITNQRVSKGIFFRYFQLLTPAQIILHSSCFDLVHGLLSTSLFLLTTAARQTTSSQLTHGLPMVTHRDVALHRSDHLLTLTLIREPHTALT